jgi:hypothetical protein
MNLSDLGKTVAKYAPLLGSVLPIPGGSVIGQAIASAFGGDIKNTDDLINRISLDPNAAVKLKEIESNERIEIERLAVNKLQISANDLSSARDREKSVRDKIPAMLAIIFTISYMVYLIFMLIIVYIGAANADEKEIMKMALMGLSNAQMVILTYYYGNSYQPSSS